MERVSFPTIDQDLNGTRAYAGHDKLNQFLGKVEVEKDFSNVRPLNSIKSFL